MPDYDFDLDDQGNPILDDDSDNGSQTPSINSLFNVGHNLNQALSGASGVIETLNNTGKLPLLAGIGILGYFLLNKDKQNGNG
jgi:hypothetical protein